MYSFFFIYAYVDLLRLLGFWGETPAAKRFPRYYRGLRERWMRESPCYFFLSHNSHAQKVGGTRNPRNLLQVTPMLGGTPTCARHSHAAGELHR